jgi:hypothetical protein
MSPVVNITLQVESTAKRRGVHATLLFLEPVTIDIAVSVLKSHGFDVAAVPDGYRRTLYQPHIHPGGRHFEFFVSDELLPAATPPAQEAAP